MPKSNSKPSVDSQAHFQTHQAQIEKALAYRFCDESLIATALTHKSADSEVGQRMQRLEFLGDRVLALCIAEMLMQSYPNDSEGDLAKRLSQLVKRATLADIATKLQIGKFIFVGPQEQHNNTRFSQKILADSMEAVISAIYLDGGDEAARNFIKNHWQKLCQDLSMPPTDVKTALQEWTTKQQLPMPQYELLEKQGPDHKPNFIVRVKISTLGSATAQAQTRKAADTAAAKKLLASINPTS